MSEHKQMANTSITVHGGAVHSFEELVRRLPPDAVASPRRSTIPLVDYWREPEQRIADLWNRIGLQRPFRAQLHFEYEVPVRAGRGKASYTDLMILSGEAAVAIEAKFTEPRYESIRAWLDRAPTNNRRDVLGGWLHVISEVAEKPIELEAVTDVPYQLLHRTASVCCASRPLRCVIYQVFGEVAPAHYAEDLRRLATVIACSDRVPFLLLECRFQATDAYRRLVARWHAGERDLGANVRQALIRGRLLEFSEPVATLIEPLA